MSIRVHLIPLLLILIALTPLMTPVARAAGQDDCYFTPHRVKTWT